MCGKEAGQVLVCQALAPYFTDFQHLAFIPQRLPARLQMPSDFQRFMQRLVNISNAVKNTFFAFCKLTTASADYLLIFKHSHLLDRCLGDG